MLFDYLYSSDQEAIHLLFVFISGAPNPHYPTE